jgi:hypothetical protein
MVNIGFLPRRVPHVPPPRQNSRTRLRRRTYRHLAIRRHMPPDLSKEPLDTEMRLQPLTLVMEDFHDSPTGWVTGGYAKVRKSR